MNGPQVCRTVGCDRMLSRDGRCRPCFITKTLQWSLTDQELRSVPLGLLSTVELRQLRRATRGESDVMRILKVLMRIAPKSLTSMVTEEFATRLNDAAEKEEDEAWAKAELWDPDCLSEADDRPRTSTVHYNSDWLKAPCTAWEDMVADQREGDFITLEWLPE